MTRDELATRITYILGLQDDTTFSESNYVTDLIYEGITDIVTKTRPYSRTINLTTTPGSAVHDLVAPIISVLEVRDGQGILDHFTREDVELMQRDGGRGFAYREPQLWIAPVPAGGEISVTGIFRPQKMTAGSQSPSSATYGGLAEEFHPTIITYCLWKGGEYVQHEASGNGEKWRIQYKGQDGLTGELAEIRRVLAKRVTPGGPRRRNPLRTVGTVPDLSYYTGG